MYDRYAVVFTNDEGWGVASPFDSRVPALAEYEGLCASHQNDTSVTVAVIDRYHGRVLACSGAKSAEENLAEIASMLGDELLTVIDA